MEVGASVEVGGAIVEVGDGEEKDGDEVEVEDEAKLKLPLADVSLVSLVSEELAGPVC